MAIRDLRRGLVPFLAAALVAVSAAGPAESQGPASTDFTYADLADLALTAPVAAHVRVAKAMALKGDAAAAAAPGTARFYVEADVAALIRAPRGMPARVRYVVDLPRDARGKAPKLRKGSEFLVLARPVEGHPGELQLTAPDAQLPYSPDRAATLRTILAEASAGDAPPRISGIGRAFHVPGAIPGESETQIFLLAADGRPVSLTVLRRPSEAPQWAVALSEIVDQAAAPPRPDSLLWYRLACTLPRTLPAQSLAGADRPAAAAIRADYGFVIERLGPCRRNRPAG